MAAATEMRRSSRAQSRNNTDTSIAEVFGADSGTCGYCHAVGTSRSFGVWLHRLRVEDYQSMLDAGWRRSGRYLYRPDLSRSCCQAFPIRLNVKSFETSSTQRRVLKRLRRATEPLKQPPRSSNTCSVDGASIEERAGISKHPQSGSSFALCAETTGKGHDRNCGREMDAGVCDKLSSLVRNALEKLTKPNNLGVVVPLEVVEASRNFVSVRRRREPLNADARAMTLIARGCSSSRSDARAEFATNVAMILTAQERKQFTQANRLVRTSAPERQMEVATAIASLVKIDTEPDDRILAVVAAPPGWININVDLTASFGNKRSSAPESVELQCEDEYAEEISSDTAKISFNAALSPCSPSKRRRASVPVSLSNTVSPCVEGALDWSKDAQGRADIRTSDNHSTRIAEGEDCRSEYISGTRLHGCSASSNDMSSGAIPTSKLNLRANPSGRRFAMEFVPSSFADDEFQLFKRYQMTVHGDTLRDCEEHRYRRFLVDSPLIPRESSDKRAVGSQVYGSFHVRYTLDGQLFAVGVVDVLPRCLSSVYLFFDPAFGMLSPGVLSALKEIEWVRQVSASLPELEYYYMGYYIHTCSKMNYKAAFKPSEILCDETRHWVPAATAKAVLDAGKGRAKRLVPRDVPLTQAAMNHVVPDDEIQGLVDWSLVLVDGHTMMPFKYVELALGNRHGAEALTNVRNNLGEFIRLVGRDQSEVFVHALHW